MNFSPGKRPLSLSRREALWAYAFIAPWTIGFIIFTIGPMLASLFFSFTDYNIVDSPRWIGATNYVNLFHDDLFWHALGITFKFAAIALPLGLVFSYMIAVLLNSKISGINIWRTVYFLPSVIAGVAVALLWARIFDSKFGILNPFLEKLGIQGPGWFSDPHWAMSALVIMSLWGVGGNVIIYLAGLQGVPTDLYEAAKVDGATAWQRFWYITLPMTTPVIFYNLVLGLIGTFQYFTEVYVISNGTGGPARATLFYNLYLYQNAFRYFHMGYASTMAWVLFIIVLGLTLLIFRSSDLWVYYEGQIKGK
ncbi:MAG: sugar ABC transporter permease [Chloroflexota bacterium]